jgi:hypothetical protein
MNIVGSALGTVFNGGSVTTPEARAVMFIPLCVLSDVRNAPLSTEDSILDIVSLVFRFVMIPRSYTMFMSASSLRRLTLPAPMVPDTALIGTPTASDTLLSTALVKLSVSASANEMPPNVCAFKSEFEMVEGERGEYYWHVCEGYVH